jgi:hemoglobin
VNGPTLPPHLIEGRRTPIFTETSFPEPLAAAHRTTVWAQLIVIDGSVRYVDLDGASRRDVKIDAGDSTVIEPGVRHQVDPSTDSRFFIQFYREPGAGLVPGRDAEQEPVSTALAQGPWRHRGRDLDTAEEIFEMVTRQYADVVQDPVLSPHFGFGPGHIDWQAHILSVTDYWCHVLLFAPDYEIDVIEGHRPRHEAAPFRPETFDQWLEVYRDTVHGGWTGPNAVKADKRATGMIWAMALRFLGKGAWRPPEFR